MPPASRPRYLFAYGTLRPGHAPPAIAAEAGRLRPAGAATVRGRVHQLGAYPGAVLDDTAATTIDGTLLRLPTDAGLLAALDAYEGFAPGDPAGSLFVRTRTTATVRDGRRVACWIYVWNRERSGPQLSRQRTK